MVGWCPVPEDESLHGSQLCTDINTECSTIILVLCHQSQAPYRCELLILSDAYTFSDWDPWRDVRAGADVHGSKGSFNDQRQQISSRPQSCRELQSFVSHRLSK